MKDRQFNRLSRRSLIKRGVAFLICSVLSRFTQASQQNAASSQSDRTPSDCTPGGHTPISPQAGRKRIYLAPDDHTDYFWSGDEAQYRQAFLEMLDYYLDQADATAGNPSDFQSRWNCDGSFWIWTYEKNRTPTKFQRLIDRIRDGHISFPLNALVVCLGGAPVEAVLRGMYYAGRIERQHNLRVPVAIAMENQTLPYGLAALWAGSGAKYSWKGICNCDTRVSAAWDRQHEIYWMVGPDGSRILMKWNSMLVSNQGMGGYAEVRYPGAVVEYVDTDPDFITRYPYIVIGAFGQGWDDLQTMDQECVEAAQIKTNVSRRVIVSNQQDFFEDFESTCGTEIPSQSCSFGNEWDLYCAALAEVSARVKRAVEKLRCAEALATVVSLQDASFMDGREVARDQAWMDLGLFWEHNFGMIGHWGAIVDQRIAWQRRLAGEVESYVDALHADAVNALGGLIQKSGSNLRFYAFNPLSWVRTDIADFPYSEAGPVHVIDLGTGNEISSQLVSVGGQQYLRVLAQNVPSVGYKVFEVRTGEGQTFPGGPSANASTGVIENSIYQVTVAPRGAITSLVDKTRGNREFARDIDGYVINDLGASTGTLSIENPGPVSVTLRVTASAPLAHTTRITLIRGSGRINVCNEITQNFDNTYLWRYGFNLDSPDVWHEEVGAVIRAKLLSQGGHYYDRAGNSRYDWLTLNHFACMSGDGGVGITLSNADCYFMKLGNSGVSTLDVSTPQLSVLVGGRVVNESNGLPNQGGDTHFLQRFALRTHDAYDPASAMRFALEHQTPLVTGIVTGGSAYPETSFSLLSLSNPDVLLWVLKPADDGLDQGMIARLWNLSASPASFSLSFSPSPIAGATHVTHIETPLEEATVIDGALTGSLAAQQLETFSITLSDEAPTPNLAKTASPTSGVRGTAVTYTLRFLGNGSALALTDRLPSGVSAPADFELEGTSVLPSYDSGQHRLMWSDAPAVGQQVTIRYAVTITTEDRQLLVNAAELTGSGGQPSTATATVVSNPAKVYLPLVFRDY